MLSPLEQFENHYLMLLTSVGLPTGTFVLTAILAVLFLVGVGTLFAESSSPPPAPSGGGGGGSSPSPDGKPPQDDKWGWKTKVMVGVGVGLGTIVLTVILGSYYGWSDPFYGFTHPYEFGGAVVDRAASVLPGLTFSGEEVRPHLVKAFPAIWEKATSVEEITRKIIEANVDIKSLGKLFRQLDELSDKPDPIFFAVQAAFPQGASGATLTHALEVAATDYVDCIILEHAGEWWDD